MSRKRIFTNKVDVLVASLGEKGFNTAYIQRRTGLSSAQIAYRLRAINVRRADYRAGRTAKAREIASFGPSKSLINKLNKLYKNIDALVHASKTS